MAAAKAPKRCSWAGDDPLMVAYHDREWGTPLHDDRALFELLTLEGAQAGLAWRTILHKREGYRRAFADFDAAKVARFGPAQVEKLMADAAIVRNRLKIESTIGNARAFLALGEKEGSFARFLWGFVDGRPVVNRPRAIGDVPAKTPLSDRLSKELKRRGFRFVGTTICYAFLQATGVVDDHVVGCFKKPR